MRKSKRTKEWKQTDGFRRVNRGIITHISRIPQQAQTTKLLVRPLSSTLSTVYRIKPTLHSPFHLRDYGLVLSEESRRLGRSGRRYGGGRVTIPLGSRRRHVRSRKGRFVLERSVVVVIHRRQHAGGRRRRRRDGDVDGSRD